jgi:hypothetical protein
MCSGEEGSLGPAVEALRAFGYVQAVVCVKRLKTRLAATKMDKYVYNTNGAQIWRCSCEIDEIVDWRNDVLARCQFRVGIRAR